MKSSRPPMNLFSLAMSAIFSVNVVAADLAYFQNQSCDELIRGWAAANKAEAVGNETMMSAKDKAAREKGLADASSVLSGFSWWASADRRNENNILAEIRAKKRLIARAVHEKKCSA